MLMLGGAVDASNWCAVGVLGKFSVNCDCNMSLLEHFKTNLPLQRPSNTSTECICDKRQPLIGCDVSERSVWDVLGMNRTNCWLN